MRFSASAAAIAALPLAAAHYTFSGLTINGEMVGRDWQYIREHSRGYMPTFQEEAATSNDFRCQPDSSGANTEVYTVKAGDVVGLRQAFGAGGMEHPGPTQVYVSKAPGSVKEYDGDGDWVKMAQSLICKPNVQPADLQTTAWCSWGDSIIDFTVPDSMPEGEYLVRAEHIALHGAHDGKAEFYYACAQVKVEGTSGTELLGDKVKIPGVYSVGDEATNFSVWGRSTSYPVFPGPDVAPGGTVRGTPDGSSDATVVVEGDGSSGSPGTGDDEETTPTTPPVVEEPQPTEEPVEEEPIEETPIEQPEQPAQPPVETPEVTPAPQPTPVVPSPPVNQPIETAPVEEPQPPCTNTRTRGRKGRKNRQNLAKRKYMESKRGAKPRTFRA
ncbi:glycosyl hydrolase family 61 domain-containing protein [Sarocladium implicatum]|nr:glycosyl hydrolase family 61 domain-containing protein [Sarocladium implicatum]